MITQPPFDHELGSAEHPVPERQSSDSINHDSCDRSEPEHHQHDEIIHSSPVSIAFTRLKDVFAKRTPQRTLVYDAQLLLLVGVLMTIGLIMVTSASIPEGIKLADDPFMFSKRHAIFLCFALVAFAVVVNTPVALWQKMNGTLLITAIVLLVFVLILGRNVNGSTRWIGFGPINLQPAEIAKLALFVYLAGYLVRKQAEVRQKFKGFFKPMFVLFLLSVLLLLQPDLGSVVVMFVTTVGMLFLAGARLTQFAGLMFTGLSAVALLIYVSPYRMKRITAFLDPWADPFGSGYQLTQSLMAFGRGGWFGEGLGNSVLKLDYLPEAHTDFVVAILAEETGFIGVMVILGLQLLLALKALKIARNNLSSDQLFAGFIATGIAIWFSFQSVVNVGAAAGILPTKGLTLPLVSYGGSSLVVIAVTVALLVRIDYEWRLSRRQAISHGGRSK